MYFRFSDLQLDVGRHELTRAGEPVPLPKLSFRVLQALVEASPEMLTHDELVDRAWGSNRVISPENLTQRIMLLRQSLGDDAQQPRYIESVRGEGIRLVPEVTRSEPASGHRRGRHWAVAMLLIAGLAVALLAWRLASDRVVSDFPNNAQSLPEVDTRLGLQLAVLPFNGLDDAGDNFLGEGISEQIIHTLVEQTNLPVVARTLSFQFNDSTSGSQAIGRQLGVSHVLEGSVHRSGQDVRVTARLIDAGSGLHLWSKQYDLHADDLFQVQSSIALALVEQIEEQLVSQGESRIGQLVTARQIAAPGPASAQAYEAYLKGLQHANRYLPDDVRLAIGFFEQAAELSPEYFPAWRSLMQAQLLATHQAFYTDYPSRALDRINGWVQQARRFHPDEPLLDFVDGVLMAWNSFEWAAGLAQMEAVLPRLQSDVDAQFMAGTIYWMLGREEQALKHWEQVRRLEPDNPLIVAPLAWHYYTLNRREESQAVMEYEGHEYMLSVVRTVMAYQFGELDEMDRQWRIAQKFAPADSTPVRNLEAFVRAATGDRDGAEATVRGMYERMWEVPVSVGQVTAGGPLFLEFGADAIKQRQYAFIHLVYRFRDKPEYRPFLEQLRLTEFSEPGPYLVSPTEAEVQAWLDAESPLNMEELPNFVGYYFNGEFGNGRRAIVIEAREGRLWYRNPGMFHGYLVRTGPHTFRSTMERDKLIEFQPGEDGEMELAFWNLGDFDYHGYRHDSPESNSE